MPPPAPGAAAGPWHTRVCAPHVPSQAVPPEVAAHHPLPKVLLAGRASLGRWGGRRGGGYKSEQGLWGRLGHAECPVPTARCCSEQAPLGTPLLQEPSQGCGGHHTPRPPSPKPCSPTHAVPRPGTVRGRRGPRVPSPRLSGGRRGGLRRGQLQHPGKRPHFVTPRPGSPGGSRDPTARGSRGWGGGDMGLVHPPPWEGARLQCGTLQGPGDRVASSLLARRGGVREAVK